MLTRRFPRHKVTATIVRPGERDNFGNEGPGIEFDVEDCLLAPSMGSGQASSTEQHTFANTVVTGSQLYLPPHTDLQATDRIRVDGLLWEVEGDVGDWGPAGMQVSLRKARG